MPNQAASGEFPQAVGEIGAAQEATVAADERRIGRVLADENQAAIEIEPVAFLCLQTVPVQAQIGAEEGGLETQFFFSDAKRGDAQAQGGTGGAHCDVQIPAELKRRNPEVKKADLPVAASLPEPRR